MANKTDNIYMQLNASELSAIIMKGSPNSNDRDAGFCSGSSEGGDDLSVDHSRLDPSSPTDASEDSVDVKVLPISLIRNKRKSSEPSKVVCEREESISAFGPLKKRIRYTSNTDSAVVTTPPAMASPPLTAMAAAPIWSPSQLLPHELMPNPAHVYVRHPGVTTLHRMPLIADLKEQDEPLALVAKHAAKEDIASVEQITTFARAPAKGLTPNKMFRDDEAIETTAIAAPSLMSAIPSRPVASISVDSSNDESSGGSNSVQHNRAPQRNYKNMTRERRIEANARERTRVHTISAAYETLRRAVPSYSHAQKLSKLSVLRVACSYILTLSRMAGQDYSADGSAPEIADCFEAVTATIQTEGKLRKKKENE